MKLSVNNEDWLNPNSNHECGPCTACCTWLGIEELKKYTGTKCKHLRSPVYANKRCGIYPSRPDACREYKCMWRQGWGPTDMRPHESGMLVTPYIEDGKVSITVIVFDMEKAKSHQKDLLASLLTLPNIDDLRLINIKENRALLFRDGKIYPCKLLPAKGYEELIFEAQDTSIGEYRTENR